MSNPTSDCGAVQNISTVLFLLATACGGGSSNAVSPTPSVTSSAVATRHDIIVTDRGFEPNNVTVPAGTQVTLRFERKVERTCATEVVLSVDGQKIEKKLPLDTPVELTLTFGRPGKVMYSCGMDMIRGSVTVQ